MTTLADQLRCIAGVDGRVDDFTIRTGRRTVDVRHSSGTANFLGIGTGWRVEGDMRRADLHGPRPLAIGFRRETGGDVAGKRQGVNREVQTGDPTFDGYVYIDTLAPDGIVRALLALPTVRAAILELISLGYDIVEIDPTSIPDSVRVERRSFVEKDAPNDRASRTLNALVALADALPYVEQDGSPRTRYKGRILGNASVALALVIPLGVLLWFVFGYPAECMRIERADDGTRTQLVCTLEECCRRPAWGLAAGIVSGAVLAFLATRRIKGQPRSRYYRILTWIGVLTCSAALVFAAVTASGWYEF